jgi:hypothetical protein
MNTATAALLASAVEAWQQAQGPKAQAVTRASLDGMAAVVHAQGVGMTPHAVVMVALEAYRQHASHGGLHRQGQQGLQVGAHSASALAMMVRTMLAFHSA